VSDKTLDLDRILELARHYPEEVFTLPCTSNTVRLARANRQHPDDAHMTVCIPDEWVKQLRGDEALRPLLFAIYIPRRVLDLAESRIVLPNERPRRRRKP
jgi:hypothetical protein